MDGGDLGQTDDKHRRPDLQPKKMTEEERGSLNCIYLYLNMEQRTCALKVQERKMKLSKKGNLSCFVLELDICV